MSTIRRFRFRSAIALAGATALVAAMIGAPVASAAQPEPAPVDSIDIDGGLPDIDERPAGPGPTDDQLKLIQGLERLWETELEVGWSDLGTPHSLAARDGGPMVDVDGDSPGDPVENSRAFLTLVGPLFGLGEADVAALEPRMVHEDEKSGAIRVRFEQGSGGLPLFGTGFLVVLDFDGRVFFAGGNLAPQAAAAAAQATTIPPQQAADIAADSVRSQDGDDPGDPQCRSGSGDEIGLVDSADRRALVCTNTAALPDAQNAAPIVVEPVLVPGADGSTPAWQVLVPVGSNAEYLIVVDAVTGAILFRQNQWSSDGIGRVFTTPDPGDSPYTGGPPVQSDVAFPASWDTGTTTSGNFANAFQDLFDDETSDAADRPTADGNGDFLFTWTDPWGNSSTLPTTGADRDATVTQLYYYTSWFHDYAYGLGFTETANNFQNDNGGNGGTGGDAVSAEADDSYGDGTTQLCQNGDGDPITCRNNANFNANGPDGTVPRMQMYVGEQDLGGGMFRRTQRAMNRDTVIHEYMHGVSGRIISNGNLQGGVQSGALGEGFGDAMATSINDDPVYGEYNNGNETTGIRGVAYTDDSLEYGDLCNNGAPNPCQVHDDGRIWAMAMWEQRTALRQKLGAAAGKALHERLMIQGMLNTPDTPSFHDARTGYLTADVLDPSPDNQCLLWRVFADNELGVTMGPDGDDDSTPTVSSATPAACDPGAVIGAVADTPEGTFADLDAAASTVGGDPGDSLTYAWDLDDDGAFDDATGATPAVAFGDDGSYPVSVRITNTAGYTDTASTTLTVTNVAPTVVVTDLDPNPSDENGDVDATASFSDPGWLDSYPSASVDLGTVDRPDVAATTSVTQPGSAGSALFRVAPQSATTDQGTASATIRYGDNGTYTVTVSVTDDDGGTGSGSDEQSVANVDPTAAIDTSGEQTYNGHSAFVLEAGEDLTVPASSSDPGSDDLTFAWDWGDATTTDKTSLVNPPAADPASSPTVQPRVDVIAEDTHAYVEACLFELGVTVGDDDGGLSPADTAAVIVTGNATVSKGHGWWLNQYRDKPPNDFTPAQLQCYLDITGYFSLVFDEFKDASTRAAATSVLNNPAKSPADIIFDQHALGAWLNFANGSVSLGTPVDTDGNGTLDSTFGATMLAAETVRINPASTSDQIKAQKDLIERIAVQSGP